MKISHRISPIITGFFALIFILGAIGELLAQDSVEFLNGASVQGVVTEIRNDQREFDFQVQAGGRSYLRTYPFDKVHAVVRNGTRFVLTPKPGSPGTSAGSGTQRSLSEREVRQIIEQAGRTAPAWFTSTPLDYPKTLDLSWPLKPENEGWDNQRNVGQYLWDVIYPNPHRWRPGIRLMHHLVQLHQNQRDLLERDQKTLADMYFKLLQDYPRAAFWFQQAGVRPGENEAVILAECYWRIGNRKMAAEMLDSRTLPLQAVKLLGDLRETQAAVRLAELYARQGRPHEAYLLAGDACRSAGLFRDALNYYQKVLDAGDARSQDYLQRYVGRAKDSIEAVRLFDQIDLRRVRDGVYRASSTAFNGDLEVEVKVASGRIESVNVTRHQEKQFYAALTDVPNQIVQKQSVKEIDATTHATITSQAIVNATAKALAGGAR
jgi:uncharacterized protein with FMN-binding domain